MMMRPRGSGGSYFAFPLPPRSYLGPTVTPLVSLAGEACSMDSDGGAGDLHDGFRLGAEDVENAAESEAFDDVENSSELFEEEDNDLLTALRAVGSRDLGLPSSATFAPLEEYAEGAATSLEVEDCNTFSSHVRFELPCDKGCKQAIWSKIGRGDWIHCFTVSDALAVPLNERLRVASLQSEMAADLADPGDDAAGVLKTNWGGFQSKTSIFDPVQHDPALHERFSCYRDLHAIASAALDELGMGQDEHPAECPHAKKDGELHSAYAWININRSSDLNFMHTHDPQRMSAVYFVSSGALKQESNGGRLLFRGGRASSSTFEHSHSFLAVPPTPATLWLFPGSVPHAVLGHIAVEDPPRNPCTGRSNHTIAAEAARAQGQAPEDARISVAINFFAWAPASH